MPRRFRNWSYKDVINFLKSHGFSFFKSKDGSHDDWKVWISSGDDKIVEINFNTNAKSYPELTLRTMIRQSGIEKKEWLEWALSGRKSKKKRKERGKKTIKIPKDN